MQSFKKALGATVFTVLASTMAVQTQAVDTQDLLKYAAGFAAVHGVVHHCYTPTLSQRATLSLGLLTVPYLVNYFTRKPLKEARFDVNKLLYGSLKEKIAQLHYYLSDNILGWPYKDKKQVTKMDDNGRYYTVIQDEQLPSGYLGNGTAWIGMGGGKALMFPAIILGYVGMWKTGIEWWLDPSLNMGNHKDAFKVAQVALMGNLPL